VRSKQLFVPGLLALVSICNGCHKPSAENGALLYRKNCAECHADRPDRARNAPSLTGYFARTPQPRIEQTRQRILNGGQFMPPFRERLSRSEIDDLIAFLKNQ
jgi:mono/diheme cytochrome c family protein